ncbi:MAG: trigger factor [Lysobacterales bacterium 69-70]|nr:trigger factor [Xanthomonadaceae bacterium]ODU32064.1 MAG: trigger factor [Xanthomonadaceae bacterium SCN 69-320]ODV15426.1 MAG: trigger factor [Xanthomonadaceae bacterium SCN 69-25]OJZ01787.1 MAG: trigger factor [Xanthomonadales bacterium 69-70]
MQVSVENVGKLERKLTVRVPADQLDSQVRNRLSDLSRNVRLNGFRPGKVPAKVIEQRFGAQVRNEAMSELIRATLVQAMEGQNLRPAMPPSVETTGTPSNGEIEYTATFEVMPEVGAVDVSKLEIVRVAAEVSDADVDAMIETLRQQRRTFAVVDRAAASGDMVLFEYSAQAGDYRFPAEGLDRVGTVIGSGALFKELEDSLIGLKAGDEKSLNLSFPAEFRNENLAGKQAQVNVKVVRVQVQELPALDDAFFAAFGIVDGGLDKFRADVKANLERELKGTLLGRLKTEVVEKLVGAYADLELPKGMIEAEANALVRQAEAQARQQGQTANVTAEAFAEVARRRVAAGLLLGEVARQNDIRLDSRRVAETLSTIASTYEEPDQVVELYNQDPQLMNALQSRVIEDQVTEWIADHAKATEQKLGFNEVMRPVA